MKELPIIFSAEMVRAILDGRKTQTRRVVKPQPDRYIHKTAGGEFRYTDKEGIDPSSPSWHCPYGVPGDRLFVQEPALWGHSTFKGGRHEPFIFYEATHEEPARALLDAGLTWGKPEKLPRWASRILLEVTDVRVERVQDISEDDAADEGIPYLRFNADAIPRFRDLWDSINGKKPGRSWDDNPFVWCISFKRINKEES